MNQPLRSSATASIVVLASLLAGCAAPQASSGESLGLGGRAGDVGLATRAQLALNSNKVPQAIQLAEQAVAKSPTDAGFRALLGNAYFAGGRFRSAESAYRDSLSLYPGQPQVMLKLALVQVALGKKADAVATLRQARSALGDSNYGLAIGARSRTRRPSAQRRRYGPPEPGARLRVRRQLGQRPRHCSAGRARQPARCAHPAVDAARIAEVACRAGRRTRRRDAGRG